MAEEFKGQNAQAGYPQQPRPQAPPQQPRPAPQQQAAQQPTPQQYTQYQQQVQQAAQYRAYQQKVLAEQQAQKMRQTQQAQQYPQQTQQAQQAQQMQQQAVMPPPPDEGHHKMLAIAAILVVMFAGLGTYFTLISEGPEPTVFAPIEEEVESTEPTLQSPSPSILLTNPQGIPPIEKGVELLDVRIDKFLFASNINEDFTYTEKASKTFAIAEPIFIYMEIRDFEKIPAVGGSILDIREDVEVRGPDGNTIPYLVGTDIVAVTETDTDAVAIQNMLTFQEDAVQGEYTITVKIRDLMTLKENVHVDTFTLTE